MNYVYDIVLNFNKCFFDFYDWNKNDKVVRFRKIPLFLVDDITYFDFKNYIVNVDSSFLHRIYKKSELYNKNGDNKYLYSFLLTNGCEAIGLNINKKGNIIAKSSLLVNEELEILDFVSKMSSNSIIYRKIDSKFSISFCTRLEQNRKKFLFYFLDKLEKNKKYDFINFIYFDYFNKLEVDYHKSLSKIRKCILNDFYSINKTFDYILGFSYKKKKSLYF